MTTPPYIQSGPAAFNATVVAVAAANVALVAMTILIAGLSLALICGWRP